MRPKERRDSGQNDLFRARLTADDGLAEAESSGRFQPLVCGNGSCVPKAMPLVNVLAIADM
jgi:hypothetical protein